MNSKIFDLLNAATWAIVILLQAIRIEEELRLCIGSLWLAVVRVKEAGESSIPLLPSLSRFPKESVCARSLPCGA